MYAIMYVLNQRLIYLAPFGNTSLSTILLQDAEEAEEAKVAETAGWPIPFSH